ncbi:MAG: hydroxylamine reductase [Thermoplasmatales archaeon SG8-52-3]|nr:MAG: hydroxylamine reductase [Thermoplasmatales archaeon SG8-52-3]
MNMFCYQCEETINNKGCTTAGACGKKGDVANLQDLLIYLMKGISLCNIEARKQGKNTEEADKFIMDNLFATITNANFDKKYFLDKIQEAIKLREKIKETVSVDSKHDSVIWQSNNQDEIFEKAEKIGILSTQNEDIRSLRWLLTYGIKGMAAYSHHAYVIGNKDEEIFKFMQEGLAATTKDLSAEELTNLVIKCGEMGVKTMALLDKANTSTYGNPEITKVNIGVRNNPGILISGHDLKDLEQLLKQTKGTGVDVYTHGEMLPANAYPAFKKYSHLVGNYGSSWWKQKEEFEKFNGPILLTTNCLVPPRDSYKDRVYTTGIVGFEGLRYIPDGDPKDFSEIIEHAKRSSTPEKIDDGEITIGFAHNATLSVADKIVDAVKSGKIKRFIVMAGCDGRRPNRQYYTDFAKALSNDTAILTAGCAKYRYNKLGLGDIDGIPRVIDAGQCNDSYSLVVIAKKLAEVFGVELNELPISFNIAWYEQKAVLVLLSLLSLGVKNIMLGPTLPAFVSPNVLKVLIEKFNIQPNSTVENDLPTLKIVA